MNSKTTRQQRHQRNQRQKLISNLTWGGVGVAILAVIGFIIWQGVRPSAGDSVTVMTTTHIPVDSDPGLYNSDPPTSGPHYPEEAKVGFYDTNIYTYPAAYLVHNLEHGYIIFWYNCDKFSESACADLKTQIRAVMDTLGGTRLIAYPWPSLDVPLAITSWGRLEKFETFDAEKSIAFYRANLNRSPEAGAP